MMNITVNKTGNWYHGSNQLFDTLREGSTITQWKELAEAFSHKPSCLSYDDEGNIEHNGTEKGYLYKIDEEINIENDIYQHPNSTMDVNAEFITKRPLKLNLLYEIS